METEFTPLASLLGGLLIGSAAVLFMALNGRILGISGLLKSLITPQSRGPFWELVLLFTGVLSAPLVYVLITGKTPQISLEAPLGLILLGGLLVGVGTGLGSGCTSGHGICGLSRLSLRSVVAVICFMSIALITVFVLRHIL